MLKDRIEKKNLIINSLVDLQEDDGKGKGRKFISRFIEPGLAHYKELGDIVITKETLDKFIMTMIGCPVIIEHKDVTDKNVDELRVGTISDVWFNDLDGWYYCSGILTDNEAIDLIKNKGWNVSCSYSFVSDDTQKTYHGKPIDMEFTDGEFLHLAIVEDPRYEGANIVVNKNDDDLEWITVKGNHIPVKKGQSKDDAVKEFLEGKEKGKQNNKEADIALTMMAQDYEKRGNKGTVDRANELKEKLKKGEELSEKDKQDIKTAIESYKPKDKSGDNKANNSIGDITMTVLNDLTDFIKKVVKNEKEEEMKEVKNEDKRKLIDEIGGILKDKVDDEIIRTVIKKAEELSYEPSEDDKADNKCKNEDEKEDEKEEKEEKTENKCKNEEDKKEEKVEDEEEEAENKKVKNSMKDAIMGGSDKTSEESIYISTKRRLEEGNKY